MNLRMVDDYENLHTSTHRFSSVQLRAEVAKSMLVRGQIGLTEEQNLYRDCPHTVCNDETWNAIIKTLWGKRFMFTAGTENTLRGKKELLSVSNRDMTVGYNSIPILSKTFSSTSEGKCFDCVLNE